MSLFGSVIDGRRIRQPNLAHEMVLDVQNVTFTGTGSVQFKNMDQVDFVSLGQVIGTAPGLTAQNFTYTVSGNTVSLFAWMPTGATNPTLIAATGSATVTVVAFGRKRYGQTV